MYSHYTNKHIRDLFGVSHVTVQTWAQTYAEFLSPGATPASGGTRVFDDGDLAVFALAHEMKQRKASNTDILLALRAGQRGEIPNPTALDRLPPAAQTMIVRMRDEITELRAQLEAERTKTIKVEGRAETFKELLDEKEARITQLIEELARLKAQK